MIIYMDSYYCLVINWTRVNVTDTVKEFCLSAKLCFFLVKWRMFVEKTFILFCVKDTAKERLLYMYNNDTVYICTIYAGELKCVSIYQTNKTLLFITVLSAKLLITYIWIWASMSLSSSSI